MHASTPRLQLGHALEHNSDSFNLFLFKNISCVNMKMYGLASEEHRARIISVFLETDFAAHVASGIHMNMCFGSNSIIYNCNTLLLVMIVSPTNDGRTERVSGPEILNGANILKTKRRNEIMESWCQLEPEKPAGRPKESRKKQNLVLATYYLEIYP